MKKKDSIKAYDLIRRIKNYDADMIKMHPNRDKMIEIALEFLPFESTSSLYAIDLGIGTGVFTNRFLNKFPNSKMVAVDGAKNMIDLAIERLGGLAERIDFEISDLRRFDITQQYVSSFDVAISSFVFHHLSKDEKRNLLKKVWLLLKPGGWFLNADLVINESEVIENRIQDLRVNGIIKRCKGIDSRFKNFETTRNFLTELELNEGDNPLTITEDLELIKDAKFSYYGTLWQEFREIVYCGMK